MSKRPYTIRGTERFATSQSQGSPTPVSSIFSDPLPGPRLLRSSCPRAGADSEDPHARAAPPEAHESLISRKTGAEVPLTGLS